jgi:hypothetical protein
MKTFIQPLAPIQRSRLALTFSLSLLCLVPAYADDKAGLGKVVVVGDSLSAGFQNGALLACQQVNGFANLLVKRAVDSKDASQPLVLPLAGVNNNGFPVRINPGQQPTDIAVPGQTLGQALTLLPNVSPTGNVLPPIQFMTDLVLGSPVPANGIFRSQVDTAIALQPDTVIVWLGNNDVLGVFEGFKPKLRIRERSLLRT